MDSKKQRSEQSSHESSNKLFDIIRNPDLSREILQKIVPAIPAPHMGFLIGTYVGCSGVTNDIDLEHALRHVIYECDGCTINYRMKVREYDRKYAGNH